MRLTVLLIIACILSNCTMQKRVHRKGWHIEWRHNQTNHSKQESEKETDYIIVTELIKPASPNKLPLISPDTIIKGNTHEQLTSVDYPKIENAIPKNNSLKKQHLKAKQIKKTRTAVKSSKTKTSNLRDNADRKVLITLQLVGLLLILLAIPIIYYSINTVYLLDILALLLLGISLGVIGVFMLFISSLLLLALVTSKGKSGDQKTQAERSEEAEKQKEKEKIENPNSKRNALIALAVAVTLFVTYLFLTNSI